MALIGLILRHGETEANADKKVRSWLDMPLDATGLEQANEASVFLQKYSIKNILCSPLLRAFVTADIASRPHNLMVYQHRGMLPWNLGIFGGMSKDETQDAVQLFVDNREVTVPNGESLENFENRIFAFFGEALKIAKKNGLTLYVCHNSTITALAQMMEGLDVSHMRDTVEPGGVAEIHFDGKYHKLVPVFGKPESSQFGAS